MMADRRAMGASPGEGASPGRHEPSLHLLPVSSRPRLSGFPTALPLLIGREAEMAALRRLLAEPGQRLVTLTGPGGVGKTRLALAMAAELAGDLVEEAAFVPLAAVGDPGLVLPTVARVVDAREAPGRSTLESVAAALAGRRLLLVLDNLEHLPAAATDIADLLAACAELTVLVTSRAPLRLNGEQRFPTPPLSLPEPRAPGGLDALAEVDAVALFLDRARRVRPDFALHPGNADAVAAICRRLDGLPLAIELAAAWSHVLAPPALLARLEQRLPLLTGGATDRPERLQTMRDAIAWSYELLDPARQGLFRRLSVFAGGFDTDAAAAVAGDGPIATLTGLRALADQSLLRLLDAGGDRFAMLETVREYGMGQLADAGEEAAARRAHAAWALALAVRAEPRLRDARGIWLDRLEVDLPNLRAALDWAHVHDPEMALRLAAALNWFWYLHSHLAEGRAALERALAADVLQRDPVRARAMIWVGGLAWAQDDLRAAQRWVEQALALSRDIGDGLGEAYALLLQGNIDAGNASAEESYRQAIELFRVAGDGWGVVTSLANLGMEAQKRGALDQAEALLEESLAINRRLDESVENGETYQALGDIAWTRGDLDRAAHLYGEGLASLRLIGNRLSISRTLIDLAWLALERREPGEGLAFARESVLLARDLAMPREIASGLEALGALASAVGDPERGARLLAVAQRVYEAADDDETEIAHLDAVDGVRASLGARFDAVWETGRRLSVAEAIAEAESLVIGDDPAPPEPAPVPKASGLTPREREVLRLLAEGKSDRELSEALFISRKTASNHVASILAKLGVENRAAAVAKAVRQGEA